MRRLITTLAAVVLLTACTPGTSSAADAEPPRVMIVGDSITQGRAGDVTWRYHLWNAFGGNLDLVGPKQGQYNEGNDETLGQYPYAFDYDHASRWGMSLAFMQWSVADLMAGFTPDIVVSQLGANDLIWMTDPAGLIAGQRAFVGWVREADPTADVVLGQLSPMWNGEVAEYNALLPALVSELDMPGARVVMASMPPMTAADDSYDGLHPNAQGEVKIAGAHEAALRSLGVTDAPAPAPVVTPPAPTLEAPSVPRRVKAVVDGRRVKVSWRSAARAESYVARCGSSVKVTTGLRVRVRDDGRCKVRAVNEAGRSPWVRA